MKRIDKEYQTPRKGGCLRYGATVFCAVGAIIYLAMGITGNNFTDANIRPAMFILAALMVFFIWLIWRPRKRHEQIGSCKPSQASEVSATPSIPDRSTTSYICNGRGIKRADGKDLTHEDIEHLRETDFERAHQYYKNNSNPKFHRTVEEEMEQSKFYSANAEYIDKLQQDICLPNLYSFSTIDDAITHDQQALIAAQELSNFCSQSKAGQQYFEDMWLHCHNCQNPDFSIIDRIKDRYADLTLNYEERKKGFELHQKRQAFLQHADADVLRVIQSNPGILQKDLHKHFDPDLKSTIGTAVSHLVKSDQIRREKQGNSYSLYAK